MIRLIAVAFLMSLSSVSCQVRAESPEQLVVLSFTDPSHCAPCRKLDAVWELESVKTVLKERNIRRDVIVPAKARRAILARWRVTSIPTTIAIKERDGKPIVTIQKTVGSMSESQLIEFLKTIK